MFHNGMKNQKRNEQHEPKSQWSNILNIKIISLAIKRIHNALMTVMKFSRTKLLNCFVFCDSLI